MRLPKKILLKVFNIYPPYLGAGIRVRRHPNDPSGYRSSMKLTLANKNYVGVHFGGSLYSMCDPFFMLIMMEKLGPGYIVWDQAAKIEFKKPGKGRVYADFSISDDQVNALREELEVARKIHPIFTVQVLNEEAELVAIVEKTLYIKKKLPA